jgi:hypothetical protein
VTERWKPVVGFEGYYEVSDRGRIRSLPRTCPSRPGRRRPVPGCILRQVPYRTRRDGKARHIVMLYNADLQLKRLARIPHIVLEAFVGPRPPNQQARHLDCDPSNNRLSNLSWGTAEENHADTLRLDHIPRGDQHVQAKLATAQVLEIRALRAEGIKAPVLAARFGVTKGLIYAIEQRRSWKHV